MGSGGCVELRAQGSTDARANFGVHYAPGVDLTYLQSPNQHFTPDKTHPWLCHMCFTDTKTTHSMSDINTKLKSMKQMTISRSSYSKKEWLNSALNEEPTFCKLLSFRVIINCQDVRQNENFIIFTICYLYDLIEWRKSG